MITVVDCGMGNLQSVLRAIRKVGAAVRLATSAADVDSAEKIILPGVAALGAAMLRLQNLQLVQALHRRVQQGGTPVLGICVGLQLLTQWSEEGDSAGLGWIKGRTVRLRNGTTAPNLKVPHVGWNTLEKQRPCPLLDGVPDDACFYFAHSYYVQCDDDDVVAACTTYGTRFVSVMQSGSIFGIQFHPEKSQANGLQVLRNFVEYRTREV